MKQQSKKIQKTKTNEAKPLVCLLGDTVLVKEYSARIQEYGIAVLELKNLSSLKVSAKKITTAFELSLVSSETKQKNLSALDSALALHIPIISSSITETVLSQSQYIKHKERLVGIAAFPTLLSQSLVELTPSVYTNKEIIDIVKLFFEQIKLESAIVQDSVGMVMPRILCQIVNEALFTVQNDVASPKDVDEAIKLSMLIPNGPIAWGEIIGFTNIVAILDALYKNKSDDQYRVSPLLRQMSVAGKFWKE